jgi:phosphatidylglycerol lysyltransferase
VRGRVKEALPALLGLALFGIALTVLRRELQALSWPALAADVLDTPPSQLASAIALTALNYAVLAGYDLIAFATIGRSPSRLRVAAASFLAYAVANNVGFAMLSGASVRYRFYTRWGVSAEELARIVVSYSVTFWLGLLLLGGLSLAMSTLPAAHELPGHQIAGVIGWALVAICLSYVALTIVRQTPVRLWRVEIPLPSPRLAAAQLVISAIDWLLAGAVLYVLLPAGRVPFFSVLGAFLAAQLLGLASHVPGGVGVFEGLMVLLLQPFLPSSELLPTLVVYRVCYYLLPLSIALVALVFDEMRQRRSQTAHATALLGRLTEAVTPKVLAVATFCGGVLLLFSGATPAAEGRLQLLNRIVPLGAIETSHFVGSFVGAALLLLSQGLARRLDAAYYLTVIGLAVGVAASMLKGGDIEEAVVLTLLLGVLLRARPAFDRKAAFFETRFSASWTAAVVAALAASVWLGLFAFKHVEYSSELWWQFELHGEASRFLRASVGAAALALLFGLARLIGHAPHDADAPTDDEIAQADAIIATQTSTYPFLVHLRDKTVLFDDGPTGFVMYGVQGRTWVAMGDPVCAAARTPDLIRLFLERCDDFGGTPVFYEIGKERLHHYADFGLTFVKLGEEAAVDLTAFRLEGPQGARFRQNIKRLDKDGGRFAVLPPSEVGAVLPELRRVSDNWLQSRAAAEKGFSLGFFDEAYLKQFPVAVVRRDEHIQAFATLWPGPQHQELSIDLMRYHHDAPKGIMEALLSHLLVWGKAEGYRALELGMAPMSGFERSPVAPLWSRLGTFLYEHGDAFYNFQGLRAFKEKFSPDWQPRYLAYPGGLRLARILADISALIAGGYRRIFLR